MPCSRRSVAISFATKVASSRSISGPVATDGLAGAERGPERLVVAEQVVPDHRVRGVEDRLGGAVVLIEDDRLCLGEGELEVEQVSDLSAPEAVDRLVGVPDDTDVSVTRADHRHDLVLGAVGVLVLVDEHVEEAGLVALEHLGVRRKSRTTSDKRSSKSIALAATRRCSYSAKIWAIRSS